MGAESPNPLSGFNVVRLLPRSDSVTCDGGPANGGVRLGNWGAAGGGGMTGPAPVIESWTGGERRPSTKTLITSSVAIPTVKKMKPRVAPMSPQNPGLEWVQGY